MVFYLVLEKLYEAIETSELTLEVLSPRIMSLRHREEQLEAAREDAETQLEQRRVELPDTEEIAWYVANFRDFLKDGTVGVRADGSVECWGSNEDVLGKVGRAMPPLVRQTSTKSIGRGSRWRTGARETLLSH